jgi:hypothetical protein
MGDNIELEADEIALTECNASYQSPGNNGPLTLTNRRLIWHKGWMITPFSLLGQREVILPIEAIEKCFSRGSAIVVGTADGEFYFFPSRWLWWDGKKVRELVARIEDLMIQRLQKA